MIDRGPIFLSGIDRSGKTLLRLMLATHPNIAMTRRTNLWFYFYNRYGDLREPQNVERCLGEMLSYKHIAALDLDADRLRREFWEGEPTYARLFALIHRQRAEQLAKPRWGDQTGLVERYADPIFAAYPDANMIHLVRDPRDRYAAARARGECSVGRSTAMWRYSVGLAARNQQRYPERFIIVRYETLVSEPEATLRAVCAFLGEPYDPAMLTMAGETGSAEPKGAISTSYIGRYRHALSATEIAFIQRQGGGWMRKYGYALDPLRLSASQQARFALVDWPLNRTRMAGWQARETIYHHFSARLGRRPGPKRVRRVWSADQSSSEA